MQGGWDHVMHSQISEGDFPESKRPADAKSCATDNAEYSRLNSFENSARRSARVHPKRREIGPVRVQPASLVSLCLGSLILRCCVAGIGGVTVTFRGVQPYEGADLD